MNKVLYLAEGETEKYFLESLKEESLILPGKIFKFNLMQNVLKATDRILTNRVDKVFCILDTDCVDIIFLENLRKNIKSLGEISKSKIRLLIQKENFEGELKFIFETNDLGKFFGLKNRTDADVKRHLAGEVNYSKYITKEKLRRYCSRYTLFQDFIREKNLKLAKSEFVSIEACMKK